MRLILASQSPRRREMLALMDYLRGEGQLGDHVFFAGKAGEGVVFR